MPTVLFLSKEQLNSIDTYEQRHYNAATRLAKLVAFLQKEHVELPSDAVLVHLAADIEKHAMGVEFSSETDGAIIKTYTVSEHKELEEFFLMIVSLAPALNALVGHEFAHVYNFSNMLADRIVVGDESTYPKYVSQILPKFIDNVEYGTEDAQTIAFRFVHVGEQRTELSIQAVPAIVRHIIEMTDAESNNGFGEIYPVIMHGNYIEFNGAILYPHSILNPVSNDTDIEFFKEQGATFNDAVTACDVSDGYWLYCMDGRKVSMDGQE